MPIEQKHIRPVQVASIEAPTATSDANNFNRLLVKQTKKMGRGVFANIDFPAGSVIEVCPTIAIGRTIHWERINNGLRSMMETYVFPIDDELCIALGYGSLYNHSDSPNAFADIHKKQNIIKIRAERDIQKGEEIFLHYGHDSEYLESKFTLHRERNEQ